MTKHLVISLSFNPLHVGAPTGTKNAKAVVAPVAMFQSPPCRGTYWNDLGFGHHVPSGGFNPLHVGAPTGTAILQDLRIRVAVSIPSMSGHLLEQKTTKTTKTANKSFNPLHVGAPTGTLEQKALWAYDGVSIPSMSGHLLERRKPFTKMVWFTFQSPPCRGTY